MTLKLLILLGALSAVIFFRTIWRKRNPEQRKRLLWLLLAYGAAGGILYLVVTGKLHALFALLGALVPWFQRGFALAPLFNVFGRFFKRSNLGYSTAFLHVRVVRTSSGLRLDVTVIEGSLQGRKLESLNAQEFEQLKRQCQGDRSSMAILSAWQQQNQSGSANGQYSQDGAPPQPQLENMTVEMACDILQLKPEQLSREVVNARHKKLMARFHPDRGGHPYFATLLNVARDFLLKRCDL